MKNINKWILGVAVVAGGFGLGATTAQAAEFGIYARGPVAYVPPCPGPGYVWAAGYQSDGYWVPGRWNYLGVQGYGGQRFDRYDYQDRDRGWDRNRGDRDRGDRDHYRR